MQSGDMSEDARGHLGDKYNKPNHPTFSDESIYSTEEHRGGTWTDNGDGKFTVCPGRKLSGMESRWLGQYL